MMRDAAAKRGIDTRKVTGTTILGTAAASGLSCGSSGGPSVGSVGHVGGGWHDRPMTWTVRPHPDDDSPSTPLAEEVRRAGYYPELVLGTLDVAVAGEDVLVDLVQAETTFDDAVHRHLTVLALTPSRLVIVHVDDAPREDGHPGALATSEAVPISRVSSVSLTWGVSDPAEGGGRLTEVTVAICWGAVRRLDLEPASCADPSCQADHGLTGTSMPDDIVVRIAAGVEGTEALVRADRFARALSKATAQVAARA